jgi:hypothetical protein
LYNSSTLATSPDARTADKNVAVIQGIFDPTGNELLALNPVFRYPWPSGPTPVLQDRRNRYLAEVTTTDGAVVRVPFDALTDSPRGEDGAQQRGFFEVHAKVSADIATVRILDTEGNKVVVTRERVTPPTIQLTSPASGTELGETTTITWDAQYGVTNDQVRYQIAYSPDGGQTFVPLAVGVPGETRKITVNTREIQKSAGNGIIRVFLSDGLNTTYADLTKLTTTAAIY